jgi:hypothetical protein
MGLSAWSLYETNSWIEFFWNLGAIIIPKTNKSFFATHYSFIGRGERDWTHGRLMFTWRASGSFLEAQEHTTTSCHHVLLSLLDSEQALWTLLLLNTFSLYSINFNDKKYLKRYFKDKLFWNIGCLL